MPKIKFLFHFPHKYINKDNVNIKPEKSINRQKNKKLPTIKVIKLFIVNKTPFFQLKRL